MLFNGGKKIIVKIKGPLFDEAEAFYGILPDNTAVIEMAAASGLPMAGVENAADYDIRHGSVD